MITKKRWLTVKIKNIQKITLENVNNVNKKNKCTQISKILINNFLEVFRLFNGFYF